MTFLGIAIGVWLWGGTLAARPRSRWLSRWLNVLRLTQQTRPDIRPICLKPVTCVVSCQLPSTQTSSSCSCTLPLVTPPDTVFKLYLLTSTFQEHLDSMERRAGSRMRQRNRPRAAAGGQAQRAGGQLGNWKGFVKEATGTALRFTRCRANLTLCPTQGRALGTVVAFARRCRRHSREQASAAR